MTLIAQITDLHLRDDGQYKFHNPAEALHAAFRDMKTLDQTPDLILLTGDIMDRSSQSYDLAQALLSEAPFPLLVMPGNHDRPKAFRQAFGSQLDWQGTHLSFHYRCRDIDVIALETTLETGKAGISAMQLQWLAQLLPQLTRPSLLALHHPPFRTGLPHLDQPGFENADALAALVQSSPICRVIAGHSHRMITGLFGGVLASTAAPLGYGLSMSFQEGVRHQPIKSPASYELHHFAGGRCHSHQRLLDFG